LANANIYNTDYKGIFDLSQPDDFIFLDPPYDCIFSDYGNEEYKDGFNDDCHAALAKDFKNLDCRALLVIGRTQLTEKIYGDMIIDEYAKNYSVNIRNRFKSVATHILVANYKTNHKTLFSPNN
jgi:DNA adenine methylase